MNQRQESWACDNEMERSLVAIKRHAKLRLRNKDPKKPLFSTMDGKKKIKKKEREKELQVGPKENFKDSG